ncbi:MAG: hypothetical protein K8I60_19650, partial [Anaerolineae bacterium]|nr:hypothetical protein [Anaerolineae bacterium]
PMVIILVLVGVIVAIVALVVVPGMTPKEIPVTQVAQILGTATPFGGAAVRVDEAFSLSVPGSWAFDNRSESPWKLFNFQPQSGDAFIQVALLEADVDSLDSFYTAVRQYDDQYITQNADHLTLIDEFTAPDGTLRRSYRTDGQMDAAFPPGQVDVFYVARDPYLAVLQMYSADSLGDSLVPTFQQVLDSLHVSAAPPTG